jgi:V8-like Glu-specific endopeptidase
MKRVIAIIIILLTVLWAAKAHQVPTQPNKFNGIVRLLDEQGRFFCSGVVISETRIATAAHCVIGQVPMMGIRLLRNKILVASENGKIITVANTGGVEPRSDQAVLVGDFSMIRPMKAITDPTEIAESFKRGNVVMCGYPYGGKLYCNKLSNPTTDNFQFKGSGHLYPGMSGVPVIDAERGIVIGINTAVNAEWAIVSPLVELFVNTGVAER